LRMDSLEVVVEELMKEQHKDMMRRLKSGEFDAKAFSFKAQLIENYEIPMLEPEIDPVQNLSASTPPPVSVSKSDVSMLFDLSQQPAKNSPDPKIQKSAPSEEKSKAVNLDDAILSFFGPK